MESKLALQHLSKPYSLVPQILYIYMQGKNDKTHLASKLKMIRLGIEIEMKFSSSVNFNPKSFNFEFFSFSYCDF